MTGRRCFVALGECDNVSTTPTGLGLTERGRGRDEIDDLISFRWVINGPVRELIDHKVGGGGRAMTDTWEPGDAR